MYIIFLTKILKTLRPSIKSR